MTLILNGKIGTDDQVADASRIYGCIGFGATDKQALSISGHLPRTMVEEDRMDRIYVTGAVRERTPRVAVFVLLVAIAASASSHDELGAISSASIDIRASVAARIGIVPAARSQEIGARGAWHQPCLTSNGALPSLPILMQWQRSGLIDSAGTRRGNTPNELRVAIFPCGTKVPGLIAASPPHSQADEGLLLILPE